MIKQIVLTTTYPLFRAKNIFLKKQNSLRVLMYHDIAPHEEKQFFAHMRFLKKRWNFISAEQFIAMLNGIIPIDGKNVLLTFDDGFLSNYHVTETILNPLKIPALFFVATDFINLTDRALQREFVQNRLYLQGDAPHWKNMKWDHLRSLIAAGHTIGSHTCSHADLAQIQSDSELMREIVGSAEELENQLQVKIEHFAIPYGRLEHINHKALDIAKTRYPYIYSGIRGDNIHVRNPYAIARDAISPQDTCSVVGAFLEGAVDRRYRAKLEKFPQ